MKAGGVKFRPRKIGSVRAKRLKKSTPIARASGPVGGAKFKRLKKTAETKVVIQPDRKGDDFLGRECSLAWNSKTSRYDLCISETISGLVYSSVSHAACLQAAGVLRITWE